MLNIFLEAVFPVSGVVVAGPARAMPYVLASGAGRMDCADYHDFTLISLIGVTLMTQIG